MARPISGTTSRLSPRQFAALMAAPKIEAPPLTFFSPPKGLDTLAPLGRVDRQHFVGSQNVILQRGITKSRNAFSTFGAKPAGTDTTMLTADIEFCSTAGSAIKWPLRWTRSKLYVYTASGWSDTGISHAIQQLPDDGVNYAMWNGLVVYSTGILAASPGMIEYTPPTVANPVGTFRLLAGSPTGAHATMFGNRIIVSAVYGLFTNVLNRIQWTVKDNDNDWAGLGSGFEDLINMSGGLCDAVMGVYPISDTTALVVRESSIWRMDLTGYFDAPFLFTLLTDKLGTSARRTIQAITGGVIFLGYDDVYIVTLGGIQRIGRQALDSVFLSPSFVALGSTGIASTLAASYGYYDRWNQRYWLNIKGLGTFVYSFDDKGWTQQVFSFEPWSIEHAYYQSGSGEFHGVYVTADTRVSAISTLSLREDPTATSDADPFGFTVPQTTFNVWTGYVYVDSPLFKTEIVEMQVEYDAGVAQNLFFDIYRDGAWVQFSTVTVQPTTGAQVLSVRGSVEDENLQVRVRSDTLGKISIYALHVFASKGALIHP